MDREARLIAQNVRALLPADASPLPDEYSYNSLSLCIIDAVFSIGIRYSYVQKVVQNYCNCFQIPKIRPNKGALPPIAAQHSMADLCANTHDVDPDFLAKEVFKGRFRTSTVNGILKAEAVGHFAQVLHNHSINFFQDAAQVMDNPEKLAAIETEIKTIPGQKSGISLDYFWMLAGSEDRIKPDRMVIRFLAQTLGRDVKTGEALPLLQAATAALKTDYQEDLTPRYIDHQIWLYQRNKVLPASRP